MPQLNWIGKDKVVNHDKELPFRVLKPVKELSSGENSENLLIQGDNLEALKALMPFYYGKIKCIYIDPPYNTGNEGWVYNDKVNSPQIRSWLNKVVGPEGEDLCRHDKWLCMMYPRLKLLHDFLSEDGVIFISIDDNEYSNLRLLTDEIFGETNFIGSIVWEGALKNDSKFISVSHDYILCYAKSKQVLKANKGLWRSRKEGVEEIYKEVERLKQKYGADFAKMSEELKDWFKEIGKKHPAWQHRHYNKVDAKGVYFPSDISWPGGNGPKYEVLHPTTQKPVTIPNRGWVFPSQERMNEMLVQDKVDFGYDEKKVPTLKRYLHETEGQVLPSVIYQDRRAAMQKLRKILGDDAFQNPKDETVLKKLFDAVCEKDDIILDSFAGSGTTAQAVLELNKEDGGTRKFILIELEKDIAKKVTANRIRRVIEGSEGTEFIQGTGQGFSFLDLNGELYDGSGYINANAHYEDLAAYIFFTETKSYLNLKLIKNPYIGSQGSTHYFLFFEGKGTNILDERTLKETESFKGSKVIYADKCLLDEDTLDKYGIVFKQIPYELKKY